MYQLCVVACVANWRLSPQFWRDVRLFFAIDCGYSAVADDAVRPDDGTSCRRIMVRSRCTRGRSRPHPPTIPMMKMGHVVCALSVSTSRVKAAAALPLAPFTPAKAAQSASIYVLWQTPQYRVSAVSHFFSDSSHHHS